MLTVVVVPFTVKLPDTVTAPANAVVASVIVNVLASVFTIVAPLSKVVVPCNLPVIVTVSVFASPNVTLPLSVVAPLAVNVVNAPVDAVVAPIDALLIVPPLIVPVLIVGEVNVLLVRVSVVALPTNVSVLVGNVNVPVFEIDEITGVVNVLFVNVFVVADKYVSNVSTVVCLIVPASLVTIPSEPATAVVPTVEPPSIRFNSAAVDVISVPDI